MQCELPEHRIGKYSYEPFVKISRSMIPGTAVASLFTKRVPEAMVLETEVKV